MSSSHLENEKVSPDAVRFKIVADDASKAVVAIKEKFGESAQVISVKQQVNSGIAGFLKSPRLELIVEVPAGENSDPETEGKSNVKNEDLSIEKKETRATSDGRKETHSPDSKSRVASLYSKNSKEADSEDYFSNISEASAFGESPKLGSAANPVRKGTLEHVERAVSMLRSVGFDDTMVERIRYELDFRKMGEVPSMEIYSRICDWLRKQFPKSRPALTGDCRAFIGASGVGKTSSMSKALSADVFVNGLEPVVLKIDGSVPNSSDGLEAFCEIMGAPLYRSLDEIEERSDRKPIYVDMPGLNMCDVDAVENCNQLLDEIGADERVLVINAAYETEVISEAMLAGSQMGATHIVFTHLDETRKAGKPWKFALGKSARPLFFSHGPNPAGDYTMDPFSYLLEKTFPQGRKLASARRNAPSGKSVEAPKSEEKAIA